MRIDNIEQCQNLPMEAVLLVTAQQAQRVAVSKDKDVCVVVPDNEPAIVYFREEDSVWSNQVLVGHKRANRIWTLASVATTDSGDVIVVSGYLEGEAQRSTYVYEYVSGRWREVTRLMIDKKNHEEHERVSDILIHPTELIIAVGFHPDHVNGHTSAREAAIYSIDDNTNRWGRLCFIAAARNEGEDWFEQLMSVLPDFPATVKTLYLSGTFSLRRPV